MTTILLKIAMLALIVVVMIGVLDSMPTAVPLPDAFRGLVTFAFNGLYIFNPVFDVPTFFQCIRLMLEATMLLFILVGFLRGISWLFRVA